MSFFPQRSSWIGLGLVKQNKLHQLIPVEQALVVSE